MKKTLLYAISATLLVAFTTGCPAKDDKGDPDPPTLGAQVDRMGRPAIATAAIATFESDTTVKGQEKDAYNAAAQSTWASFAAEMAENLAILDSIDEVCGNQLLYSTAGGYGLAGVLADDRLWVNSTGTGSEDGQVYLAVEANAVNIIPNTLSGGRNLTMDIAETSYSVLALGAVAGADDGIAPPDDAAQSNTTFPFVAAPSP